MPRPWQPGWGPYLRTHPASAPDGSCHVWAVITQRRFTYFPYLIPILKTVLLFRSNYSLFRDEGRGALMAGIGQMPAGGRAGTWGAVCGLESLCCSLSVLPLFSLHPQKSLRRQDGRPGQRRRGLDMFTQHQEWLKSLIKVFTPHTQGKLWSWKPSKKSLVINGRSSEEMFYDAEREENAATSSLSKTPISVHVHGIH